MKHLLKISSLAVLLATAAFPVLAADTSSSSSSMMSSASSSAAEAGAAINYGTIISAIQAHKMADLSTITASSTISFALMSDVKANGNATALDNAMKKNVDAATIKSNVDTNATLTEKLTTAGYTSDQVVAVIANDDGSFTVVINDQHP